MSASQIDKFFSCFQESFRQVLSQCSGSSWSAEVVEVPDGSAHIWFNASISGGLSGGFAFGMPANTVLLLAQSLMMTTGPAASLGAEEQEATLELLRQVCGLCATALAIDAAQPIFEVDCGEQPSWQRTVQKCIQMAEGNRQATITVAISPELAASAVCAQTPPSLPPAETDHSALDRALSGRNLDLLMDVHLGVRLRFGSRRMKLREILEFQAGTIVELDRQVQEPVDLLVDDKLIARGEVVVVDGNYGLKVTDVLSPQKCMEALY